MTSSYLANTAGDVVDRYHDHPLSLALMDEDELALLSFGVQREGEQVTDAFRRAVRGDDRAASRHMLKAIKLGVDEIQHRATIALQRKSPSVSQMAALLIVLTAFKDAIDAEIAKREAGSGAQH